MRIALMGAIVLSVSVPFGSHAADVQKQQAMAACKYELLKLGYDAFTGSHLADMCMTSKGFQYDLAMPKCSRNVESMFDYDCFTTLERWEKIWKDIEHCNVDLAKRMDMSGGDDYAKASEACLEDLGYVNTGFGKRPAGYGLDN
jgi:hypothetical protein